MIGRVHVSVDRVYCEETAIDETSNASSRPSNDTAASGLQSLSSNYAGDRSLHHSQLNVDDGDAFIGVDTDAEDGMAFLYAGHEILPFRGCMYHVAVNRSVDFSPPMKMYAMLKSVLRTIAWSMSACLPCSSSLALL